MGSPPFRRPLLAALVAAAQFSGVLAATEEATKEFVLGVRVLGKSIRDTGMQRGRQARRRIPPCSKGAGAVERGLYLLLFSI
jgi:hypothetical protein